MDTKPNNIEFVIQTTPVRRDIVLVASPDYPTPADIIRSHWDGFEHIRIEQQIIGSDSILKTKVLLDMPISVFADAINTLVYAYDYEDDTDSDTREITAIRPDPSTVQVFRTNELPQWALDSITESLDRLRIMDSEDETDY